MSSRSKEQTRELILETGRDILNERGVPEGIPLRLADVLHRLELTTGAAYHIWDSQEDFRADLALYCAVGLEWPGVAELRQTVEDLGPETTFDLALATAAQSYFASFTPDSLYMRFYWWTIHDPSPNLAAAVRSAYSDSNPFEQLVQWILERFLRVPANGMSLEAILTAATALLEGFSLRYRFEPHRVSDSDTNYFVESLRCFLTASTQPQGLTQPAT